MQKTWSIKNSTNGNFKPLWISFVILLIGLIVTFTISNYFKLEEEARPQKEFTLVCNEIKSKIITRIDLQAQFLHSGASFFEASNTVSRKEWKIFNKFSRLDENFIGVQGFGYAAIVEKEQLKDHIATIRKEGFPEYTIFPSGEREIYTSILYLEPFDQKNSYAIGFDMFSEKVRRAAMEKARDYNIPSLSGKIYLLRKTQKNVQAASIMYLPVYKNGPINTIAERRAAIIGWVYIPFRIDDLMQSILSGSNLISRTDIRLQIYDDNTLSPKTLLFDSYKNRQISKEKSDTRKRTLPFLFNKKKWTLIFSEPSKNGFFHSFKTLVTFFVGLTISLLLFALTFSLLITKERAKQIAKKLTLDLENKNQEYEKINLKLNTNNNQLILSKEKLKETNDKLQKALVKAEESDQLKSAFLANMSHEIRTPMNGILGFTELLKEVNLNSDDRNSYIEIIEKSGNRLLNIINDIIDISKIEAGQMLAVPSITDVDEQMQYILTFFKPETNDKGIDLCLDKTLPEKKTLIRTDREKLYAILINLVKNAIKYTSNGTIEFGYHIKGDYLEFFVKDTGIGISKHRQKAIFERFVQADFNDKMARQGAGLGLSIAKSYVELLGGKIWVESELNKGSVFYFTLPYINNLDKNDIVSNSLLVNQEPCEVKNLKILITEDDNISRLLISKAVQPFSKEILKAKNGLNAVEICRDNPDLDLILMDIQMPIMNGYEATKEIRKFNTDVVILAQTAFALEGDKEKTIEAGCNGYISKPINKVELSRLIQFHFGQKRIVKQDQ